jgi:hypothetical protein
VQRSFFSIRSLAAEGESVVADDGFITEGFTKNKRVVPHLRPQQQFLQANFHTKALLRDLCESLAISAVKDFDRIYETVGCVKCFLCTPLRALEKERHFALGEGLSSVNPQGSLLIVRSELFGST